MPWTPADAERHTKAASTPRLREIWSKTANRVKGSGGTDASAIRIANAEVNRAKGPRFV